jgi:hypothetical protein
VIPFGSNLDEPSLTEDAEMLRHSRLADVHGVDEITDGALCLEEQVEDLPSVGLGEHRKDG